MPKQTGDAQGIFRDCLSNAVKYLEGRKFNYPPRLPYEMAKILAGQRGVSPSEVPPWDKKILDNL